MAARRRLRLSCGQRPTVRLCRIAGLVSVHTCARARDAVRNIREAMPNLPSCFPDSTGAEW
jgi:hypothetical protein